jgi:hypothetical protein
VTPAAVKSLLVILGGTSAAFLAYLVGQRLSVLLLSPGTSTRVRDMMGVRETHKIIPSQYGSQEFKIRLAFLKYGINVATHEQLAFNLARLGMGIAVSLAMWGIFGLPPGASMAGMIGGVMLANSFAGGAWGKMTEAIDREIPIFLSGFTSTIQVNPNVLQAVEEESGVLSIGSPLQKWLRERFIRLGQERGVSALDELIQEAFNISNALGVMVFLMGRLWRTGGMEWARSFALASSNLEGVMEARIMGLAAGTSAKGAVKVIIGVTLAVVIVLARNPLFISSMQSPVVQIVYAGASIVMIFGYGYMGNMIDDLM